MIYEPEPIDITPIPKLAALYTIGGLGESCGDATGDNEIIILEGGRGGGKSESIAQMLVLLSRVEKTRILCTREIQESIADSVYEMLEEWINVLGFRSEFHLTRKSIIHKQTGTDFMFKGMETITSDRSQAVKSLKGVKYVWYEEADTATVFSLRKLNPSIRINGRKLIFSLNRRTTKDAVIEFFEKRKNVLNIKINYMDNPYCPKVLLDQAAEDKILNMDDYRNIWLGEPIPEDSSRIVLPYSWLIQCIDLHKKIKYKIEGRTVGGFDVADGMTDTHDKNSIAIRQGPMVKYVENWRLPDIWESVKKINRLYPDHGFDTLYFDATGLGVAAKSEFNRLNTRKDSKLPYYVIPFMGAMKPAGADKVFVKHGKNKILNKDFFKNQKSQGWWNLRLRLENSMRLLKGLRIDRPDYFLSFSSEIPNLDSIFSELSQAIFDEDNSGKIIIDKAPGETEIVIDGKKKTRKSPNDADSIKYSFAGDFRTGLRAHNVKYNEVKII